MEKQQKTKVKDDVKKPETDFAKVDDTKEVRDMPVVGIVDEADPTVTPEQIQEGLNALRGALITQPEKTASPTFNGLEEIHGKGNSRNTVKINKDKIASSGEQRLGMFVHSPQPRRGLLSGSNKGARLGKGAQKIDEDRPVHN